MPYKDPEDQKRYMKQHYLDNKEAYVARANTWNRTNRAKVREFIRSAKAKPCVDCGVQYPYYVMQFDHLDPTTKKYDVGSMNWSYVSLATVAVEIAKCEPVCANCHAERTHRRRVAGAGLEPATCDL